MDESKTFVSAPKLWLTVQTGPLRGTTVEVSGDEVVQIGDTVMTVSLVDPELMAMIREEREKPRQ